MEKTVVLVLVLAVVALSAADPGSELLSNEILGDDLMAKGWDFLESTQNEFKEEGRDPFKKALLPFLIGITLKAGSLVPVKLMIMTFIAVMALVFAKLGLVISGLLGYLQYQESHKAKFAAVSEKWFIPSTTHSTPIIPSGGHESHAAASEPLPAVAPASAPANEPNTKRFQHYQYDPYRYEPFNNDPYRFNRYDYPH